MTSVWACFIKYLALLPAAREIARATAGDLSNFMTVVVMRARGAGERWHRFGPSGAKIAYASWTCPDTELTGI